MGKGEFSQTRCEHTVQRKQKNPKTTKKKPPHTHKKKKDISPWFLCSRSTEAAFPFHWIIQALSIMAQAPTAWRSEQGLSLAWGVWSFNITPSYRHELESILHTGLQTELVLYSAIQSPARGVEGSNGFQADFNSSGYFQGGLAKMVLTQHFLFTKMLPLLSLTGNRWWL